MMYNLARGLQLLGLIVLPMAIMGNVAEQLSLKDSLILSAVGGGVFLLGYLLQQGTRPK
ncbi:MAG: hypothetical protein L0Z62_39530 [Gemmataceae bacterium]|nr:hypothetical protein [Gemmataceae bacterium]